MFRPFVTVEPRPKLSVNITKSYSSKYKSGGGTPAICDLLRNPNRYSKEVFGFPQSGQQASSSFLRIKTKSQNEFTLFKKKYIENSSYSSFNNEKTIGYAITQHPNYHEIKDFVCLPIYDEKRVSGNELLFRKKETDLESCRNYLQPSRPEAVSYLFHQLKNSVNTLNFLHNNVFNDDRGIPHYGIIHGDIKPDNILLDKKGNFLLADFGCAHFSDQPISQLGMLTYLSPELLKDAENHPGEILPNPDKNDIWSLGVTMKSLLTDEYPIQTFSNNESRLQTETLTTQGYVIREASLPNIDSSSEEASWTYNSSGYVIDPQIQDKKFSDSASFFSDNLAGRAIREKRAITYLESTDIYQKNLNSKNIIKELCSKNNNDFSSTFSSVEIFDHLTSMMLLPVLERPSASELKEVLNKLTVYFPENSDLTINFSETMLENLSQEKEKNQMAYLLQTQNEATLSFTSELMEPFSLSNFMERTADPLIKKDYLGDATTYLQDQKKELSDSVIEDTATFSFNDRVPNNFKESSNYLTEKQFTFFEAKTISQECDKAVNFTDPGHLNETSQPLNMEESSLSRKRKCQRPSRLDGFFGYTPPEKIDSDHHPYTQIEMSEQNKDKHKAIMYRF